MLALELRPDDAWRMLLLWAHRSDFGVTDPLLHRDVGYYVFSLPLYLEVARWLLETIAMGAVAVLASYAVAGVRPTAVRAPRAACPPAPPHRRAADRARLALPARAARARRCPTTSPGASYSDEHVRLPALRVLSLMALAGAAACLLAGRRRVPVTVVVAIAVIATLSFSAKADLPGAIDRFTVAPQVLSRERPHVEQAIAFTRPAYALDQVERAPGGGRGAVDRTAIEAERDTVENVPLWDEDVLRPAMNELQTIGRYYAFPSVTVDRYMVGDRPQVMTIGARQLALRRLSAGDRSWATDRFAYTHGYGAVAVHGAAADGERYPRFAQLGFDGAAAPIAVTEPRIYFGERRGGPPYVVLNTRRAEVDAPVEGDRKPDYHYAGDGGIPLSDPLRRLAFAARFRDLDLLLTETATTARASCCTATRASACGRSRRSCAGTTIPRRS